VGGFNFGAPAAPLSHSTSGANSFGPGLVYAFCAYAEQRVLSVMKVLSYLSQEVRPWAVSC
jgi:hypothetical protein